MGLHAGMQMAEIDLWEIISEKIYNSEFIAQNSKIKTEQTKTKSPLKNKNPQKAKKQKQTNRKTKPINTTHDIRTMLNVLKIPITSSCNSNVILGN